MADDEAARAIADLRRRLYLLWQGIGLQIGHWRKLPAAIASGLCEAERRHEPAAQAMAALLRNYAARELTYAELRSFADAYHQLRPAVRALGDGSIAGSLSEALHNSVLQHVGAASGVRGFEPDIRRAVEMLRAMEDCDGAGHADSVAASFERCADRHLTIATLQALSDAVGAAYKALPDVGSPSAGRWEPKLPTRNFRVLIVDDEEEWRRFGIAAVEAAAGILGRDVKMTWEQAGNLQEALAKLRRPADAPKPAHLSPAEDEDEEDQFDARNLPSFYGPEQVIAIVDIGLPKDDAPASTPHRENGHALLKHLRSYKHRVPCVVLTAEPHSGDDRREAALQGVERYLLKAPERLPELVDALLHLCARARHHRVCVDRVAGTVRVDDVPVELAPDQFRVFYALAALSRSNRSQAFDAEAVFGQAQVEFDEFDYAEEPDSPWDAAQTLARRKASTRSTGPPLPPGWAARAATYIHLWDATKRRVAGDPTAAWRGIKDSHTTHQVRSMLEVLEAFRSAHPNVRLWTGATALPANETALAAWVEEVFGGLQAPTPSGCDSEGKLQDTVYQIRRRIQEAFAAHGRDVDPKAVLSEQDGGYRLAASVELTLPPGRARDERPLALVVEDVPETAQAISGVLANVGFRTVVARSTQGAVEAARLHRPDLISLDMQIPDTDDPQERGRETGGVEALAQIREVLPQVAVFCPTTFYDTDTLVGMADKLGVSVLDFISKNTENWLAQVCDIALRMQERILALAEPAPAPPWRTALVELLPGSDPAVGRLKLRVNGRETRGFQMGKQGKLAALLIAHRRKLVTLAEIDAALGEPLTDNKRRQLVKYIHQKIGEEWLPPGGGHAPDAEHWILERQGSEGYILHALLVPDDVEVPHGHKDHSGRAGAGGAQGGLQGG